MIKNGELINFKFKQSILGEEEIDLPESLRGSDYYWKKPKLKSIHSIIEFDKIIILSRIFISSPTNIRFEYNISIEEKGAQLPLGTDEIYTKNTIKMLDLHYMPCKYVHFYTKGFEPFCSQEHIKCYGFDKETFKERFGDDMLQMIYSKASKIVYGKNI